MCNILDKINKTKFTEVIKLKKQENIDFLKKKINQQNSPRNFVTSIEAKLQDNNIAVIAEIKRASPSKGIIRQNFNLLEIAKIYDKFGAACISILTDETYFLGSINYIQEAKKVTTLPILRKDFIIDEYQIYQSRAYGADAILLIARLLSKSQLQDYEKIAHDLGMSVLVEVHDESEIHKCNNLKTKLIGINNRNLKTFNINLENSIKLSKHLKNKIIVAESGINNKVQITTLKKYGINTFLIGESLMQKSNISITLQELLK